MPTNLDRIQCLLQPEPYAQVRTLAGHNRRALSAMAAELIEHALKDPKYRDQLEEAEIQVPVKDDPREAIRQTALASIRERVYRKQNHLDGEPTYSEQVDAQIADQEEAEKMRKLRALAELAGIL